MISHPPTVSVGYVRSLRLTINGKEIYRMTDDPKGPVEDDLEDPAKQNPSPDLPSPVEGNDDEDDTEEPADLGEEVTEGEEDG